jgi:HK97 family phage portal protein
MSMAKLYRIFGRDIAVGKRLFGLGREEEDFAIIAQQKFGMNRSQYDRLDSYQSVVYACISTIAEAVAASYQPYVYRQVGDQVKTLDSHELIELLRRPSGRDLKAEPMSFFSLLEATESFYQLQGEVYWYMGLGKQTGRPREIDILRGDRVGKDIDPVTGDVTGYFVRHANGQAPTPLEIEEVLPFSSFNPKTPYNGMGTTEAAEDFIATDDLTNKFTRNFFNNNAGISGIMSVHGEVTKGAFKKFVRAFRAKHEGVDAAGKLAFIRDSEASFTKVGLGLDELDMSALRKMSLEDIAMMFRVPLPLLGKSDQSGLGRANVETMEYIFAKYNVEHKLRRYDAILEFALERYYGATDLRVGHVNIIPEDKEFMLQEKDKGVDRWLTRQEVRSELNLDALPGDDKLYVPINQIPIDESAPADTGKSKGITIKRRITMPVDSKKKDVSTKAVNRNESFRLKLMRNQAAYERKFKTQVKNILIDQEKEALRNLEAYGASLTAKAQWFDDGAYDEEMVGKLLPIDLTLTETQGALALTFAGADDVEYANTEKLRSYLRNSLSRMSASFNDATLEALERTMAEGIAAGEPISALKKRVSSVYEGARGYRATRIARTETLKASNAAARDAYAQSGYVKQIEWYVNPDACNICEEFSGKVIEVDGTFAPQGTSVDYTDENGEDAQYLLSYEDIDEPPLHPNCRCTILPVR